MFKPYTLFYADGYKIGHPFMLAPGTDFLYGTWIPRSLKYAAKGIMKIVSFGQQLTWRWLNDEFTENFFERPLEDALKFGKDMSLYLGLEYNADHFVALHKLGYLPMRVKALPEGIETNPGIPHMTFINTVKGFAWLTLYLETIVSSLSWKSSTSATIALRYRRTVTEWVMKTDPKTAWLIPFMCHDFSARGLDPFSMLSSGLGHATSFRGSDSLITIPGARYFYGEPENEVCINSVNASEHSVSTTKIFTVGEKQMILDWMKIFPKGILSWVIDTFSTWEAIKLAGECKEEIMAREGKLVFRPDSGDPVEILCGHPESRHEYEEYVPVTMEPSDFQAAWSKDEYKGVVELLWDIFGGTTNDEGFKVLDPHVGVIYGDSITPERQLEIYKRLAAKGFAATNVVLGVGSYTYQFNTRDTLGFAAKGAWFENNGKGIDIYKDPVTDDGTKKSLKGKVWVYKEEGEIRVQSEVEELLESKGLLQVIFEDGKFYNQTTLTEIRQRIDKLV